MTYIIRRVFSGLVLVFALTLLAFSLFWLIPNDPWRAILNDPTRHYTAAEKAAANHKLGVDRPVVVQYGKFVWRIVRHFDFGTTYYGNPVKPGIERALPVTWSIVGGGAVLLFLLAVPLGTLSALRANTSLDRAILLVSIGGVALHPFIIGAGLKTLFASKLHWLPGFYYCPLRGSTQVTGCAPGDAASGYSFCTYHPCGGVGGWALHLALPWLTFAVIFLPLYMRMVRTAVIDVLDKQYVLTARAKGSGPIRLLRVHVLRNALMQPLTMIGMEIGLALTVSIYIETMFSLHGAGTLAIGSLGFGTGYGGGDTGGLAGGSGGGGFDLATVAGITFVIALTVIVLNLIVDLAYAYLDPRIRLGGTAEASA
jgi:peptide/nickel transport system permease protein